MSGSAQGRSDPGIASPVLLIGRYRDAIAADAACCTPWSSNTIVDPAWTLLAALLKRDEEMAGILFCALGVGEAAWDQERPSPAGRTSRLTAEVRRVEIPADAIAYLDATGQIGDDPTNELEIRLTIDFPEAVTLREFGLFGGDATGEPNSGLMINHVIHERIDLEAGQRLTRQVRLAFGRGADRRWVDVPAHSLGEAPHRVVDGVGERYGAALAELGIETVDSLARIEPGSATDSFPRVRFLELRAKARLVLRTAAEIQPPEGLHSLTAGEILRGNTADIARDAAVAETDVVRLREQLSTLELTLDQTFLGSITVGSLAAGAR